MRIKADRYILTRPLKQTPPPWNAPLDITRMMSLQESKHGLKEFTMLPKCIANIQQLKGSCIYVRDLDSYLPSSEPLTAMIDD